MRAELSQIPGLVRLFAEPIGCLLAVAVFVAVFSIVAGGLI